MGLTIHHLRLDPDMKLLAALSQIDRFDATWSAIERREGNCNNSGNI